MDEEILAKLKAMGISEEDLQDPKKVEELAKEVELENKDKKIADDPKDIPDEKSKEILNNQLERLAKAISKRVSKTEKVKETKKEKAEEVLLTELDIDNRVYIKSKSLSEDKVKALEDLAHLPSNKGKSFEDIAKSSLGSKALSEIDETEKATSELDANADEKTILNTKNELFDKYEKTGKEPESEYEKKVVAEKELEKAGFKEY